jgi:Fur family zinc uptake transcriptional regulator
VSSDFLSPKHNHSPCVKTAVQRAREAFRRNGLSLTPLREAVFREIAASHRAIGAYEVREKLRAKGRCVQPMSVYRIIDACIQAGIVRRFESGNAFYVNSSGNPKSPRIVLACQECGYICDASGSAASDAIAGSAISRAFALKSVVIEALGVCRHCAQAGAPLPGQSRQRQLTGRVRGVAARHRDR